MDSTSPEPQPEDLAIEGLAAARLIRAAAVAARTAGSIDTPLPVLTQAELDAPISEADADPWEGKKPLIRGYSIVREIGSGGQATVYRASQEATGLEVAIKVIPGGPFVSSRRRARFDREAKILAGFDHPNIVGIRDRGRTEDGSFFIVMDFVDGVPLDLYWTELDGRPQALARLFARIAGAVDEAHQRGVVHRDLKPSNIRVDRRGEPHVLDFGLARLTDANTDDSQHLSLTQSGQMVGSIPWSSPEQATREETALDYRADVYSLGVMLYQAVAGKFPYKIDGSLGDTLKNIATYIPIAPSRVRPTRSKEDFAAFDNIVLKALAKKPEDRYSSARGIAEDLENFVAGRAIRTWTYCDSRRLRSLRYALCFILIASFLGWTFIRIGRNATSQPVVAKLPTAVDPSGVTFVRVPIGSAWLGSSEKEVGRRADETRHVFSITTAFWISATEITQGQFVAVMGFNPSDPKYLGTSFPVQRVTWYEAEEFCHRLGIRSRVKYRLPTEAEWEYACRAGELAPFGNGLTLDEVGWWAGNSGKGSHAVATKRSNFWGLYDMRGGVAEWCLDPYGSNFSLDGALAGPSQLHSDRVIRGGSFLSASADCRAAARAKAPPETRSSDLGFRVVHDDAASSAGAS